MTPLFLFGTLQYRPLLEAVLGVSGQHDLTPATLLDFQVNAVAEGPFPMIEAAPGAQAHGMLIVGLSEKDVARLDYYENAFDYARVEVILSDGQMAQCYLPQAGRWTADGPWSLDDWARDWGTISVMSATEVMSFQDQKTPAQIAQMFPMIRARAWSVLNAANSGHGQGTLYGAVEIAQQSTPYIHYFAVQEYELRHERFDGGMSPVVSRAVFRAPDATLVLPYDARRDRVLLVEQMRVGPLARGDRSVWQLEPIAGRLDPGETPEQAARREAIEEAGLSMGAIEPVAESYPSPGNSSEFLYIYVGQADLPDNSAGIGGLDAEDEDIKSHLMSFDALMEMCDSQKTANAPLAVAAYWLARHRERLRAAWQD